MLTIAGGIILAFFGIIIILLILNNLGAILKGLAYLLGFVVIISVILYIITVDNKPPKASDRKVLVLDETTWDMAEGYNPAPPKDNWVDDPVKELTFIEVIMQFDKKIAEARPEDKDAIETARAEYVALGAKRRPMTVSDIEKMIERYYDSL